MKAGSVLPLAAVLLAAATACGGSGASGGTKLTVFAAASLTEPFTAIGKAFEEQHPQVRVEFSFGASSDLATQVNQGAPADVIATASTTTMDLVKPAEASKDFAANSMEIAVPAGNPAHIRTLQDLTRKGVKLAVCQAEVPCGAVAATVFANAEVTVHPVTEETDVKAVLTKVSLGELDAGIVYVSDVKTAGKSVTGVPIPDGVNAVTTYPISVVRGTKHQQLAEEFEKLVLSSSGHRALAASGFANPRP